MITVLMTVYNGERFIAESLESILAQDTPEQFEMLVVDDGSTDGTVDIVERMDDPRIRLVKMDRNVGRTRALNRGLDEARGERVAIIDADDTAQPSRLRLLGAALDADPSLGLAGSNFTFMDSQGNRTGQSDLAANTADVVNTMPYSNPVAHSSVMYRRDLAVRCGGYPNDYPYAHDMMLYLEILRSGHGIRILPDYLVNIRQHDQQMTVAGALEFARRHDMARAFALARSLDGVSAASRAKGVKAEVYCALRCVNALRCGSCGDSRSGKSSRKAFAYWGRYALRYPYHLLRAYWVNADLRKRS